jgi:hypothetical protein
VLWDGHQILRFAQDDRRIRSSRPSQHGDEMLQNRDGDDRDHNELRGGGDFTSAAGHGILK